MRRFYLRRAIFLGIFFNKKYSKILFLFCFLTKIL